MKSIVKYFTPSETDKKIIKKLDFKHSATWVATFGGVGFMRPAPGTWGSLAALPFGAIIIGTGGLFLLIFATILITFYGFWATAVFEKQTGEHDSKMIVIDEVAGQLLALWPATFFYDQEEYIWIFLASFLLFRFFDITKFPPADYFDRKVDNAAGVMLDDIVAGAYALLILSGVLYAGIG